MSTPCCQCLRPNRLVVSEYEVPKVLVSESGGFLLKHPVLYYVLLLRTTVVLKCCSDVVCCNKDVGMSHKLTK